MRILQLVLAPRLSGAEMIVKGIAIAHRGAGHDVGMASLLPAEADFADAARELAAHRVPCLFPRVRYVPLARLGFLYGAIRRFAPDIVFAHTTLPALYARALPLTVPIVFVMHSGTNDFAEDRWLRCAERLLSHRARAIVGVAQRNVDQYAATIGRPRESFVVPNGVDVNRFRVASGSREHEGGGEGGEEDAKRRRPNRIVQIGRYMPEKGQLETVRAFHLALTRDANVQGGVPSPLLHLCGVVEDRDYHAQVVALVERLGMASSVRIEGPRADVPQLLAQADAFAMPSRFEAHSVGFLEALASGVPVVASAIDAFAFARDYPSVSLVDTRHAERYARALTAALHQPRAARPLEGLTLEDTAGRYLEIARRVVTACGPANARRREAASRR